MAEQKKEIKWKGIVTKDWKRFYDWSIIKKEFFESSYLDVKSFFIEIYWQDPSKNGAIGKQVTGWKEEKDQMKAFAFEQTKQKIVAELYTPSAEELAKMHKGTIQLIQAAIQKITEDSIEIDPVTQKARVKNLPALAEIERIWKIIKVEKQEPTAISKNENGISQEDRDLLRLALDTNIDDEE